MKIILSILAIFLLGAVGYWIYAKSEYAQNHSFPLQEESTLVESNESRVPETVLSDSATTSVMNSASTTDNLTSAQSSEPKPQSKQTRTHVEIEEDPNKDSNIFRETNSMSFITDDWRSYSIVSSAGDYGFTFKYPKEWKYSGSDHFLLDGKMIASFSPPGIVIMQENQSCFDNFPEVALTPDPVFGGIYETLIKQEEITYGNKQVVWTRLKHFIMGTMNRYCVQETDAALIMSFYSDPEDQSELLDIVTSAHISK